MKKILSVVLLIIFLMGCSQHSNHTDRTGSPLQTEIGKNPVQTETVSKPVVVEIDNAGNLFEYTSNSLFFSEEPVSQGYDYTEDRARWFEELESHFDIVLDIRNVYEDFSSYSQADMKKDSEKYLLLKQYIDTGKAVGLYKLTRLFSIEWLIEDGLILPLDEFVKDNEVWQSLPSEVRSRYYINGQTWGIPSLEYKSSFYRYYRRDWLDAVGMQPPVTINDFHEMMTKFTYDDPDSDGVDNTSGAIFQNAQGIDDIFAAFDARVGNNFRSFVAYNPNTGLWEDSITKPEMVECLEFLLSCVEEKILIQSANIWARPNEFTSGYSGSWGNPFNYVQAGADIRKHRPKTVNPEIGILPGLIHNAIDNVTPYRHGYSYPLVLLRSSNDSAGTMNILLNSFMGDKYGYMTTAYGLEGSAYTTDDNRISTKTVIGADGKRYIYMGPEIIRSDFVHGIKVYPEIYDEYMDAESYLNPIEIIEESPLLYEIPANLKMVFDTDDEKRRFEYAFNKGASIIDNILSGSYGIEEGMQRYKEIADTLGLSDFLQLQNEILKNN